MKKSYGRNALLRGHVHNPLVKNLLRLWTCLAFLSTATAAVSLPQTSPADLYALSKQQTEWCGTPQVSDIRQKLGKTDEVYEPSGCPLSGDCDHKTTRDATEIIPFLVKVMVHVMRDDNGNGGVNQGAVDATIAEMNSDFAPYGIQFVSAGTRYHNDSQYYCIPPYDPGNNEWYVAAQAMKRKYAQTPAQTMNIFVSCQEVGPRTLLGYGIFPWWSEALTEEGGIWLNEIAVGRGNKTATHEMGHCLGLYHTFRGVSEVQECGICYEFATGLEGDARGDLCSDTKPTPLNRECSDPPASDCEGTPWGATPFRNYMGYGPDACVNTFTTQQRARMHCWSRYALPGLISPLVTDTYISQPDPDRNFCSERVLIVDDNVRRLGLYKSLLHFPVPTLPDNYSVRRGLLRIYCQTLGTLGELIVEKVSWREGQDWDQCLVTWSTRPVADLLSDAVKIDTPNRWYELDITPVLAYWYNNPSWHNKGIYLAGRNLYATFSSTEDARFMPTIDIDFEQKVPDFAISISPPEFVVDPGESATYSISVSSLNGFQGPVALSVDCHPGCIDPPTLNPNSLTVPGTAQLTVSSTAGCAPGRYDICVLARSGTLIHDSRASLQIGRNIGPGLQINAIFGADSRPTGPVIISYRVKEPNGQNTITRDWQYSVGGGNWNAIDPSHISNNSPKPPGDTLTIIWDTMLDLPGYYKDVRFRMKVDNGLAIGEPVKTYQLPCDLAIDEPIAICFDNEFMYIFDSNDQRIYKITVRENVLDCAPHLQDGYPKSIGTGNIRAIAYDPAVQQFYAVDYYNDKILRYDAQWRQIGSCNTGDVRWPGITWNWKDNRAYLAADRQSEIRRGAPCPSSFYCAFNQPSGIAFDGMCYWITSDSDNGRTLFRTCDGCNSFADFPSGRYIDEIAYHKGCLWSVSSGSQSVSMHNINPGTSEYAYSSYFDVVPVLIRAFRGTVMDEGVMLSWELAADEDIAGFTIYRKGQDQERWMKVGPSHLLDRELRHFVDRDVTDGVVYEYVLVVVTAAGLETRSQAITVSTPTQFVVLYQNYPNPFNPVTTIRFTLPRSVHVELGIYNVQGQLITVLADRMYSKGSWEIPWTGVDLSGRSVASGIYLCRLTVNDKEYTKKMILVK